MSMKNTLTGVVFALAACLHQSAHAQWQFTADLGVAHSRFKELGRDGHVMVREHGYLPGIGMRADLKAGQWRYGAHANFYQGDIDYDGHTQRGAAFTTTTGTRQQQIGIEVMRAVTDTTEIIAGLEWDKLQRDIRGRDNVLGLEETYRSYRFIGGAQTRLFELDGVEAHIRGLLVYAKPERLHVDFENNAYDSVSFKTKSGTGARIAIGLIPLRASNWELETEYDWIRIDRSDDAYLYRSGQLVALVAQPEHVRSALTIKLKYKF